MEDEFLSEKMIDLIEQSNEESCNIKILVTVQPSVRDALKLLATWRGKRSMSTLAREFIIDGLKYK